MYRINMSVSSHAFSVLDSALLTALRHKRELLEMCDGGPLADFLLSDIASLESLIHAIECSSDWEPSFDPGADDACD